MLEEDELALKRTELHVVEARGRVSDQSAKIARLKSRGEAPWKLSKTSDYLKRTFSLLRGTGISCCVAESNGLRDDYAYFIRHTTVVSQASV